MIIKGVRAGNWTTWVGSLTTVTGILTLGWYLIPKFINLQISQKMVISPETNPQLYSTWIHPPIPVYFKIYLFNVSNPEQVQKGFPPELVEMGPYVFLQNKTKVDVKLDDASDTATYKDHVTYHFCEELSLPWSLQDVVTIINVPFVSAAIKIEKDLFWPLDHIAHMILLNYNEPIFIQKTVEEVLFQGYKVPFLEKIEEDVGMSLLKNNTFGFFIGQNDSYQGPFKVRRGLHLGKNLLGKIIEYKNKTELSFWGDKNNNCNQLNGTDGTMFSPLVNRDTILKFFITDLCRSFYFTYNADISFHDIPGYKFTGPVSIMEDPRVSATNRCFCKTVDTEPEKCLGTGALDLSSCRDGAPIAMSGPHFFEGAPEYLSKIGKGLHPNREKHEPFLEIEPLTGIILRVNKRVQVNLALEQVSRIPSLEKVPKMLFPLLWADEGAAIDESIVLQLKTIIFWLHASDLVSKCTTLLVSFIIITLCTRRVFSHDLVDDGEPNNQIVASKSQLIEKILCKDGESQEEVSMLQESHYMHVTLKSATKHKIQK